MTSDTNDRRKEAFAILSKSRLTRHPEVRRICCLISSTLFRSLSLTVIGTFAIASKVKGIGFVSHSLIANGIGFVSSLFAAAFRPLSPLSLFRPFSTKLFRPIGFVSSLFAAAFRPLSPFRPCRPSSTLLSRPIGFVSSLFSAAFRPSSRFRHFSTLVSRPTGFVSSLFSAAFRLLSPFRPFSTIASTKIGFVSSCLVASMLPIIPIPPITPKPDVQKDIERGLGEMIAAELERAYGVVDDPVLTDYVQRMGKSLADAAGRKDVSYRFRVLKSEDVNAVAAPGGFIYVNAGTLRAVRSEDELAAVMGHEVGHVAGRHAMKQLNAQLLSTLALMGMRSAKMGTAADIGGLAGALALLKYSRDEENDADRRGLANMTACGFDPEAMTRFFRLLETLETDKPSRLESYFMTHPPVKERIKRVGESPYVAVTPASISRLARGLEDRGLQRSAGQFYERAAALSKDTNYDAARLRTASNAITCKVQPWTDPHAPAEIADRIAAITSRAQSQIKPDRDIVVGNGPLSDDARNDLNSAVRDIDNVRQNTPRQDVFLQRHIDILDNALARTARSIQRSREAVETATEVVDSLERLSIDLKTAALKRDGASPKLVSGLENAWEEVALALRDSARDSRERKDIIRESARSLRIAANTLSTNAHLPLGVTAGQYDIVDLQVRVAGERSENAGNIGEKSAERINRARLLVDCEKLNFLAREIPAADPACNRRIAYFLGVQESEVASARRTQPTGEAVLQLTAERSYRIRHSRKRKGQEPEPPSTIPAETARKELSPIAAGILLTLITRDLTQELPQ